MSFEGWTRCSRTGALAGLTLTQDPAVMGRAAWTALLGEAVPVPTRGTVVGVALNGMAEWDALAPAMSAPPYKAPPEAPVLYLKPANTWSGAFDAVTVPASAPEVEVGATLAVVFSRDASHVRAEDAWHHFSGVTLVNDLSIPSPSYYRPPVKQKCLDGFCVIGPWIAPLPAVPEALEISVAINGEPAQTLPVAAMRRCFAQLTADISSFMTLRAGDVLLLGLGADRPRARAGDLVTVACPGIGRQETRLVAELQP